MAPTGRPRRPLAIERRGTLAIVTMVSRPYNLIGPPLTGTLTEAVGSGARAVVLGSGLRNFCAAFLAAMRRPDLAEDPRFAAAAARRADLPALREVVQSWMRTFPDMEALDAQLDEGGYIDLGEVAGAVMAAADR